MWTIIDIVFQWIAYETTVDPKTYLISVPLISMVSTRSSPYLINELSSTLCWRQLATLRILIINLNLFVTAMLNDFKSHVNLFIILNGAILFIECSCRNPNLGLTTKAKGLQECGPRGSPGVTSHTTESVRKCERVNPHTLKATPTLGDGVLVDSQNFKERFQR